MKFELEYKDLTQGEKIQVRETYAYIRSIEEEKPEEEINTDYVENCKFEREDGYVHVLI